MVCTELTLPQAWASGPGRWSPGTSVEATERCSFLLGPVRFMINMFEDSYGEEQRRKQILAFWIGRKKGGK